MLTLWEQNHPYSVRSSQSSYLFHVHSQMSGFNFQLYQEIAEGLSIARSWEKVPIGQDGILFTLLRRKVVLGSAHWNKWTTLCWVNGYGGLEKSQSVEECHLAKYDARRGGWDVPGPPLGCFSLWKGIVSIKDPFAASIRFRIGNGRKIFFWHDVWVGDSPLPTQFPELFRCARDPLAKVRGYIEKNSNQVFWGPIFRRNLLDAEESQFSSLLDTVRSASQMKHRQQGLDLLSRWGIFRGLFLFILIFQPVSGRKVGFHLEF